MNEIAVNTLYSQIADLLALSRDKEIMQSCPAMNRRSVIHQTDNDPNRDLQN